MIWFVLFTLVIIGIIFLFLEITVIPGFGIAGMLGGLSLLGAFSYSFYLAIFVPGSGISLGMAMAFITISLAGGIAAVIAGLKIFPNTKLGKAMILSHEQREEDGFIGTEQGLELYLGEIGVAETDLRPTGYGRIKGDKIDVKSDGEYITKGEKIKVIKVEANTVTVEKIVEEAKAKETKVEEKQE